MIESQDTVDDRSLHHDTARTVERFLTLFNQLDAGSTNTLGSVYGEHTTFTDPFVTVHGLSALTEYFNGAYENVIACRFAFCDPIINGPDACVPWVMHLKHKRIRRGESITVDGISHLKIVQDRVVLHRDYFDAGQLLYENLPLLGTAVRWLRKHAA